MDMKYGCSNGKTREASRLGVKSGYEEWLLQWQNWRMKQTWGKEIENCTFAPIGRKEKQAELGEKLKKRIFAPTGRRKKQAGLGQRERKQDIYSNKKKRREKQVGVTKQKKKNCSKKEIR